MLLQLSPGLHNLALATLLLLQWEFVWITAHVKWPTFAWSQLETCSVRSSETQFRLNYLFSTSVQHICASFAFIWFATVTS